MTIVDGTLLAVLAVNLTAWLTLLVGRGGFWNVARFDADGDAAGAPARWPSVAVIVPARNEAATISRTIAGLIGQDYAGELSVIVVDDGSEDGTADVARHAGDAFAIDRPLAIVSASSVPAGWTGKVWALETGVEAASGSMPDLYWFVDADVDLAPDTLRRLVVRLVHDDLSLASLMIRLRVATLAERLLVPPFLYFFLMLYPPRWIADPGARTAGAAGACLLIRRAALDRIGGLAAIRGAIIDDCSLARAVKRAGGRVWMGLTRWTRSLRGYDTFGELRDLIARTAFTQLDYSPLRLIGTLAALALVFFAPPLLACSRDPYVWPGALAAWAIMSASFVPTLRYYEQSPFLAPLLPLSALFYAYATTLSALRYWSGRGGQWKGRSQARRLTG